MRTLSGMEVGEEMVIYRRCNTHIIDAGTPTYAPTISFMALSVVKTLAHSDLRRN